MAEIKLTQSPASVSYCSSLKDDVWHDLAEPCAFESWHFGAVSDDGREALVIAFHDNYPLSPRYFEYAQKISSSNGDNSGHKARFPAVSFFYSVNGKLILGSVIEFRADEFHATRGRVGCSIGKSSFAVDEAEYGSGFIVRLDLPVARKRRIKAELEWVSVESDLLPPGTNSAKTTWNMVSPRSDVSGRIMLVGRRGATRKRINFRGTGYHDHFRSDDLLRETSGERYWGRAHFVDSTVIFSRESIEGNTTAKLFLIRNGGIHQREVFSEEKELTRDRYGLKIARQVSFVSDDSIKLRVKPLSMIRSGFSDVVMLSEITLGLRDGKPRKTIGITEFTKPGRMANGVLRWLSDLRIGKDGRSPLF